MVNEFGNGLNFWAVAWLMFRAYPHAPWVASSVISVQVFGLLLGSVLLGLNLDHWNRRKVLIAGNLVLAGLVALMPFLIETDGRLWLLFGVSFCIGLASSLPAPSLGATLPSLVPAERLQPLQGLFGLIFSASNLAAPLVSGLLIAAFGGAVVLWINALTFGFAALCYAAVHLPQQASSPSIHASKLLEWWGHIREGLGFVASRPAVWGMVLMASAVNAITDPYSALFVPRMTEKLLTGVTLPHWLGSDPQAAGLGLFDTAVVWAEFLATLWLGTRNFDNRVALRYLATGCGLVAVGMLGAVQASNLGLALFFCGLQGLGFAPIAILLGTLIGRIVPENLRGRVGSVRLFLGQGLRPVSLSLVGLLLPLGVGGVMVGLFGFTSSLIAYGARQAARDIG